MLELSLKSFIEDLCASYPHDPSLGQPLACPVRAHLALKSGGLKGGCEGGEGVAGRASGSSQTRGGHSPSCSSILSHSSSTKCFTFFRFRLRFRTSARIRPGVPTTTWGQFFFNTSSSFLMERPPKNTDTYEGREKAALACQSAEGSHPLHADGHPACSPPSLRSNSPLPPELEPEDQKGPRAWPRLRWKAAPWLGPAQASGGHA